MTQNEQKPKKVAIYTRVSTLEQSNEGFSLAAQLEKCRAFVFLKQDELNWEFYKHFEDAGFSAGSKDRPQLKRLLSEIDQGLVDVVLVTKLDRFSRSVSQFYDLWEHLQSKSVDLVSTSESIDTTTPAGRMFMSLLMTFAQFERETIIERSQAGIIQKLKRQGFVDYMGGRAPFGYVYSKDEKKLVIVEEEAEIVRDIFNWYFIDKKNASQIAVDLKTLGIKPTSKTRNKRISIFFTPKTITSMIKNPIYAGKSKYVHKMQKKVHYGQGDQDPILNIDMIEFWEKWFESSGEKQKLIGIFDNKALMSVPNKQVKESMNKHNLLLKGFIFHSITGEAMTPYATNKGSYYIQSTAKKIKGEAVDYIPAKKIESVVITAIETLAKDSVLIEKIWLISVGGGMLSVIV